MILEAAKQLQCLLAKVHKKILPVTILLDLVLKLACEMSSDGDKKRFRKPEFGF